MEFCIGIVSSIVTKAAEYVLSPIKSHVKYISNHDKNVQILKDRAERLKDARERVQHSVDAAKRNGEEIEHDVVKWLSTVDKEIHEEVEKVMQDEEKAKKNCFIGLCPNPWTRYKHSQKAEVETNAVAELLKQGTFERVSYRSAPQVGFMAVSVKGFEEFESRKLVLNGIMEALEEDGVSVIGVYGMGGIGKTTLVKQVARKVKGELFDSVVIATVTQTLDVKEIQNQIADLLGLKFEEQSMVGRAHRLRERLSKENKILVVLDDIWAKLDIGEVGIPFGDEHKGCKILLTSRELNVLSNGMVTQKNFAVGILKDKEAWDLFKKMAGDCVEKPDLQPTAMEVAKKCAGLPIAIATVASALRDKSLFEWKNALRELKRPSPSNITGITAAHSAIEWSYNYIKSEEVKMTFLLCSLIGHNGSVEDLVRYTLGLGLFGGVNTLEESRNKVLTVVANLKASCLLLDSYNDERFDIHDVVWDAALTIASRDGHMLVLRDHVPKEWSDKEKMHNWSVISLCSPHIIDELPKEMECSGLSFFHMDHNGSVEIPRYFFKQTKSLKVLDLFGMQFLSLRELISHLTDLRMLCLRECAVEDITIIGELKNLEILSLAESDIKALPLEIAQLSQLRLLDLNGCSKLKVIPPNVLSSLSKLEELYMERSFAEWEDGGVVGNERRNASLDELNNLPRLTTLYAHIPDAEMIPKHRFIETLDRYRIIIGADEVWDSSEDLEFSRTLSFKLHKNMYLNNGVKMLLKKTEDLYLDGLEGIKNVLVELNTGEGFPYLKRLNVENGMQVQYITMEKIKFSELCSITLNALPQLISFCSQDERCSTSSEPLPLFNKQFVFPSLESLELSFINAKRIWNNQTYYWVSNLTKLIIKACPNLEHLLSPSMARNLLHLQQFEIANCESLREIIFTEEIAEEKKDVICFPRLNSLNISGLQNLIIFCSGNYNIEFPLLKELKIQNCPKLKEFISQTSDQSGKHALFNEKAALPSLESLQLSFINAKRIWNNQTYYWVSNLTKLIIKDCPNLEHLLSPSMARNLLHLQQFEIANCESLREIIFTEEIAEEKKDVICFPRLNSLNISGLQNLIIFCSGNYNIEFPLLKELKIQNCPKLKEFISQTSDQSGKHALFNEKAALPSLESLQLSFINAKRIWNNQTYYWVSNLTKLIIKDCPNLEHLLSPSMARNLLHLQQFEIANCESLREIIFTEEIAEEKKDVICFPRLNSLNISGLQNLIIFCSGNYNIEFPLLKELKIQNCPKLKEFISQTSDQSGKHALFNEKAALPSLERMTISRLRNVKMIFELGGLNTKELHAVDSQQRIPSFQNLREVYVWDCSSLKNVFPASIAKDLPKLEALSISRCGVEEIVLVGEGAEQPVRFKFPQVSSLVLTDLEKLKCFYEGQHTIVWPMLKKLRTDDSTLPKILALECLGIQETNGNNQPESTIGQSVSLVKEFVSKVIPKLEELELHSFGDMEQFPPDLFHRIKDFRVHGSHGGSSIFHFLQRFYNLKSLELFNFNFKDEVPCKADAETLTRIRNLRLSFSKNLKHIWKKDSELDRILSNLQTLNILFCDDLINIGPLSLSFQNLTTLEVSYCKMINLVTPLVVQSLVQLTTLSVECCSAMTEIVANEGDGAAYHQTLVFGKLKCLKLWHLESLTSFCPGGYTFEFPYLEELFVDNCHRLKIFSQGVLRTPQLQCVNKWRWAGDLNTTIQEMYIEKVGSDDGSDDLYELKFSDTFPDLMDIWNRRNPREILGFKWLETVEFCNCSSLKYIFTPSMLLSFKNLHDVKVKECNSMEEVINEEEEATTHELRYRMLRSIEIESCPNLTKFYMGSRALEFPELGTIKIADCPKMNAFCSSISREKRKETSGDAVEKGIGKRDVQHNTTPFFSDQVLCPSLKFLTIDGMRDCTKIWPYQLAVNSLCKLQHLNIQNCDSLEEIIEQQGLVANESDAVTVTTKFAFPELTSLVLRKLPELKRFYSRMQTTQWPSLERMDVIECPKVLMFAPCGETQTESRDGISNKKPLFCVNEVLCPNLKYLTIDGMRDCTKIWSYQLSVNSFCKLEHLIIQNCDSLEEIIEQQGVVANESDAVTVTTKFAFPKLTYLGLRKLPELKRFYSRMHTTQWPSLKRMDVIECPKVLIFAPCGETQTESRDGISNKKPLFCVNEDTFPILEVLTLKQNDMMNGICQGQLSLDCFKELKSLNLECSPETSATLPYHFIRSLPNLEKLLINDASICQIVQSEVFGNEERHTPALTQIKELRLSKLPELTLKTLEPFLQSFKNLTTLEVSSCNGFINLMSCTTVKSLMVLERMSITDCEMIEEIIACEGEEIQGAIVFPKLKYLELSCLQNLASFSLGDQVFEFPVLQTVIVRNCKNMRSFCQGDLSTPNVLRLHLTRYDEDRLWWEGDLNATIKHMFNEKNVQNSDASEVPHRLLELE